MIIIFATKRELSGLGNDALFRRDGARGDADADDGRLYWGSFERNAAATATEGARRPVPGGMSPGFAPG
jgi:hypothetical protein